MTDITYRSPVGRLALDRYDFNDHLIGNNFRHLANQIDLNPHVTINSVNMYNVQSAISALSSIVVSGAPDASTSTKGVVRLTSDFGGTANSPKVVGIQGVPVSSIIPSVNNVLSFNGSSWVPSSSTSTFLPGGDLSGTYNSQQVVKLTGTAGNVYFDAMKLTPQNSFEISYQNTNDVPKEVLIKGQSTTLIAQNGGSIKLQSGDGPFGAGEVSLNLGTSGVGVGVCEIQPGQWATFLNGKPDLFNLPYGTGSGVVFMKDAAVLPGSTLPGGGVLLYSNSGRLHCKHSNGDDIEIGSTPNPNYWGRMENSKYSIRSSAATTTSIAQTLTTFQVYFNTSCKIEVVILGKAAYGTDCAQYRLQWGVSRHDNDLIEVGDVVVSDVRTTAGAANWIVPNITMDTVLKRIYINTGANLDTVINWFSVLDVLYVG